MARPLPDPRFLNCSAPHPNGEIVNRCKRLRFVEDGQFQAGSTAVFRMNGSPASWPAGSWTSRSRLVHEELPIHAVQALILPAALPRPYCTMYITDELDSLSALVETNGILNGRVELATTLTRLPGA